METLPFELKSKILRSAVGVFKDHPHLFMRTREAVCCLSRNWRDLGLADSMIWSHVFVSPRIERADILRRAARCPSNLDIYMEFLDRILDPSFLAWFTIHVSPLLLRCSAVSIVSPHLCTSMDLLETLSTLDGSSLERIHLDVRPVPLDQQWLEFPVPVLFRGLLPQLKVFTLRRNFLLPSATPFYHTLQELRLFSLHSRYMPTMETMLDVFHSTPSLARLHMRDVECSGWKTSSRPSPVLAHLTHLAIIHLTMGVIDLCSYISMPSLHTFHLEFRDDDPIPYMHLAWIDIFLGVTTAIIRTDSWDHDMLGSILRRFSAAIRIDLRKNDQVITAAFYHIIVTWEGCFVNAKIVLLPTWLPRDTAADLLTRRRSGSRRLHLITPISLFDLNTFVEYYALAGTVVSRPVVGTVDYWD